MNRKLLIAIVPFFFVTKTVAQSSGDPKLTEVWNPVPAIITPGITDNAPPADAIILFNGKNGDAWQHGNGKKTEWTVERGVLTVKPKTGNISTKQSFGSCQLHIEWRIPANVKGDGQGRGNSGIFLMSRYELQILDSYENITYSNGQAASLYKQRMPLVNASRKPGEWQSYDIIFTAPSFNADSSLRSPARITAFHNGVLVQNNFEIWGPIEFIGIPKYKMHRAKEPLILQDHGDLVSFRNIWIREL